MHIMMPRGMIDVTALREGGRPHTHAHRLLYAARAQPDLALHARAAAIHARDVRSLGLLLAATPPAALRAGAVAADGDSDAARGMPLANCCGFACHK